MSSAPYPMDLTRFAEPGLPSTDAMMIALLEQQRLLQEKDTVLAEQQVQLEQQQALIAVLEEKLRLLQQQRFGTRSEQGVGNEGALANEAETLADEEPDAEDGECETSADNASSPATDSNRTSRSRRPKGLAPELPRVQRYLTLSDEEREGAIETFFVKVREELDIIPARVQVIEIMQEKAVNRDAEGERTLKAARRPPHPIGRSIASSNLLAWVVVAKYADALPLYRLEAILARYGGQITRSTLANWIIRFSVTLGPLLERFEHHLMQADYLQGDETRLQVLKEPGMAATSDKWMWVLRGGPPGRIIVQFRYDRSRRGAVVEQLLDRFEGRYFQSDGYTGYDKACAARSLVHLGCMDHARRKVVEAVRAQPKVKKKGQPPSLAMRLLSQIDALYRLERQWKTLDDETRYTQRQQQALPKLEKLHAWLGEKQPKVARDTLTRKAIDYLLNQWDHLVRYCEHGQLHISNVLAENAIRPFALGRKAWLFSDSRQGAEASAAMFTLIETARANDVEPFAYLQHVTRHIATADTDEALDALMPWAMK